MVRISAWILILVSYVAVAWAEPAPCRHFSGVPRIEPLPEGTQCITVEGPLHVVFTYVRDPISGELGWRDEVSQRIWFEMSLEGYAWDETWKYCEKHHQEMPTGFPPQKSTRKHPAPESDFVAGRNHGVNEVIMALLGRQVWSSTPIFEPDFPKVATRVFVYDGQAVPGETYLVSHSTDSPVSSYFITGVCISKRK